jgi:hypothetical protein
MNDNENLSINKYFHLADLYFDEIHDDYLEEFLIDTKTCLTNNIHFCVDYEILKRVTQKFTRDTT